MQDVDTYERLLEVWRSHETAENQAVALWEANAILHDRMPAWRLAVDGTIIAVNRLAAWIWGAPLDAGNIDELDILGKNVFDVFAQNFERLPLAANEQFWTAKLRVANAIYQDVGDSPLGPLLSASPEFRKLATLTAIEPLGNTWYHSVRLRAPIETAERRLLEFDATVQVIRLADGSAGGYVAQYRPVGGTEIATYEGFRRALSNDARYVSTLSLQQSQPQHSSQHNLATPSSESRPSPSAVPIRRRSRSRKQHGGPVDIVSIAAVLAMFAFFIVDASIGGGAGAVAFVSVIASTVVILTLFLSRVAATKRRADAWREIAAARRYLLMRPEDEPRRSADSLERGRVRG